jgi:hypothetical protein
MSREDEKLSTGAIEHVDQKIGVVFFETHRGATANPIVRCFQNIDRFFLDTLVRFFAKLGKTKSESG